MFKAQLSQKEEIMLVKFWTHFGLKQCQQPYSACQTLYVIICSLCE